jgi:TRAP-type C4-dicarboxylate transport system permease large subunit
MLRGSMLETVDTVHALHLTAMTATVAGIMLEAVSRAIVGFVVWTIGVIVLIVLVPPLTLWLPRLLGF